MLMCGQQFDQVRKDKRTVRAYCSKIVVKSQTQLVGVPGWDV
jgi:hypothetical protein